MAWSSSKTSGSSQHMAEPPPRWFLEGLSFVLALATTMNVVFGLGRGIDVLALAVLAGCLVYWGAYRLLLVEEEHLG